MRLRSTAAALPLVLAVMMVFVGGTSAQAQQTSTSVEDRAWAVTPFIGVAFGGNLETSPATGGAAFGWGGRGFGFEGEISRLRSRQGVLTSFDFTTWTFMLNGTYGFESDHNFTPYGLFGIGFQRVNADLSGLELPEPTDDSATEFAWNVGAGINTWLTTRAGVRADLRYVNGGTLSPDFWRVYGGFVWRIGAR